MLMSQAWCHANQLLQARIQSRHFQLCCAVLEDTLIRALHLSVSTVQQVHSRHCMDSPSASHAPQAVSQFHKDRALAWIVQLDRSHLQAQSPVRYVRLVNFPVLQVAPLVKAAHQALQPTSSDPRHARSVQVVLPLLPVLTSALLAVSALLNPHLVHPSVFPVRRVASLM